MTSSPTLASLIELVQIRNAAALAESKRLDDELFEGTQIEICMRLSLLRNHSRFDLMAILHDTGFHVHFYALGHKIYNPPGPEAREAMELRLLALPWRSRLAPDPQGVPGSAMIREGCSAANAALLLGWRKAASAIEAMELQRSTAAKPPKKVKKRTL